jgi:hypothetical protein
MAPKMRTTYKELDLVSIPEDIPELGIEAGTQGTVDTIYADGRGGQGLYVEVSRENGTTVGFVQLETSGASGDDDWRVMAYSAFD